MRWYNPGQSNLHYMEPQDNVDFELGSPAQDPTHESHAKVKGINNIPSKDHDSPTPVFLWLCISVATGSQQVAPWKQVAHHCTGLATAPSGPPGLLILEPQTPQGRRTHRVLWFIKTAAHCGIMIMWHCSSTSSS